MNLSYFRKSKFSLEETKNRVTKFADENKFDVLGEIELDKANGVLIQMYKKDWLNRFLKEDKNLIGLIPTSVYIVKENKDIYVGAGNPTVLGSVSPDPELQRLSFKAEQIIKQMINEVTEAGELVPSDITLYSTMSCPYCTMEKEWLEENNVRHTVVYVDQNPEEAEKLVEATGQMGVPVTKIEFEDFEPEYIVGFNKIQIANMLGIGPNK